MSKGSLEVCSWLEWRRGVLYGLRSQVYHWDRAEDIAQETLMRAWLGLKRGKIRKLGMAWLKQVSRRIVVDQQRERERAPQFQELFPTGESLRDPRRMPRQLRTWRGTIPLVSALAVLEEALEKLPPDLKPVLRARARGASQREIAYRFGLGLSVVRMRLARGRRILETEILRDLHQRGEL